MALTEEQRRRRRQWRMQAWGVGHIATTGPSLQTLVPDPTPSGETVYNPTVENITYQTIAVDTIASSETVHNPTLTGTNSAVGSPYGLLLTLTKPPS